MGREKASIPLGAAIQRAREERDWTRYRLAKKAGMSAAYLRDLEEGNGSRPGVEIVARIAHALGISTDALLAEAGIIPAPDEGPLTEAELIARELRPRVRGAWFRLGHTLREMQDDYDTGEA